MRLYISDNKIAITIKPLTIHFHLPKDAGNRLTHRIEFIINHRDLLAEHAIKNEVRQLLSKYKHGKDIRKHWKE